MKKGETDSQYEKFYTVRSDMGRWQCQQNEVY